MTREIATISTAAVEVQNLFAESLVAKWLKFAAVSKKSNLTYRNVLRVLFKHFKENGITQPTRESLIDWRDSLIESGKKPATVALYVTTCKIFFRWLAQEGLFANIADHIKTGVRVSKTHNRDALSLEQAQQLLTSIEGDSLKAKRDRAVVSLMLTAGLRCIEIERADVGDVHYIGGACFMRVMGKGRSSKDAEIRIADDVATLLKDYLAARGKAKNNAPLFISCARRNFGDRLTADVISRTVKALLKSIGIDSSRITAHSLRHFAATQALIEGESLEAVSQVLRHTSIATSMIYAHHVQRLGNSVENTVAAALFSRRQKNAKEKSRRRSNRKN